MNQFRPSGIQGFRFNEKYLSQIPALQQFINLGFEYLTPVQALFERAGKSGNILLERILSQQLKSINRIQYKGQEYLFSEENIQSAIQKLKNVKDDGLQKTNEAVYDLLTLGTAQEQFVEGNAKSFNLRYIDWGNWANNAFHVTAEFGVERARSTETARPDIILFVNGIPFVVIECTSPKVDVGQAVSQCMRNQRNEYIPQLFTYIQLVMGINKNAAKYASAGTATKFWSTWKELRDPADAINLSVYSGLSEEQKDLLFIGDFAVARRFFGAQEAQGKREITEQDRAIYSLCRPERLLEFIYKFIVYQGGIKKIARYPQYFVVKSTLERIKRPGAEGRRQGGIIWHTHGSGKSLTMVMLTRNLALDPGISNPRIVLVTDRIDLDKQLNNTFAACGLEHHRAKTGRDLLELLSEKKAGIVTTLIHKFDKALNVKKHDVRGCTSTQKTHCARGAGPAAGTGIRWRNRDESTGIFMLVDDPHRTNFGSFAARMRQMFPKACYLGFTGTPLMTKEKNGFARFGGLIEPHYSIAQAVTDKAVVPLFYEGRHLEMGQDKAAIDLWFERRTQGLSKAQKAGLKHKCARAKMLNKADRVIYMRAFDISGHYRQNWKNTGFKAQLVAPDKIAALKYHEYLNEIGYVSSEVMILAPDRLEGCDEAEGEPADEVAAFWIKMMQRYGSEKEYNEQIVNQFLYGDDPEILVVVDKLLTGFDAPPNAVMYLCCVLRGHTLLQAIARVNRLYEDEESGANKEYGYIVDYASVLGELDQPLSVHAEAGLTGFDQEDIKGALRPVKEETTKLPRHHSDLLDLFKAVKNQQDEESYELLLADLALREEFYQRLAKYGKCLGIALSTEQFITQTPEAKLRQYKDDMKRFQRLNASVKMRYAESTDYRDYESKIKKLLGTHIQVQEECGVYESKTSATRAITGHAMAFYGVLRPLLGSGDDDEMADKMTADASTAIIEIFEANRKVKFWDDCDAQKQTMNEIDDYLYDEIKGRQGIDLTTAKMDDIIECSMQLAKYRRLV